MESSLQLKPSTLVTDFADNVHPGVTLLTTLYNEKDLLLFRPVETWIEGDRKKSRVDYKHVRYRHANRDGLQRFISHFDFASQKEFTNQFFGALNSRSHRTDPEWRLVACPGSADCLPLPIIVFVWSKVEPSSNNRSLPTSARSLQHA